MSGYALHLGDCLEVMRAMPDNSVDAIVTDPPYHLTTGKKGGSGPASYNPDTPYGAVKIGTGLMGMTWDGGDIAQRVELWAECLRVLKPGGHLLAFSGTRTQHRMVCAIEDAGFEVRDQIGWVYATGFPKNRDIARHDLKGEEAARWAGWGTALKPSWEPICVARKPLVGTVAANLLAWGTGALNIDACRVPFASEADEGESKNKNAHADFGSGPRENAVFGQDNRPRGANGNYDPPGRWPANLIHDGSDEVLGAFPATNSVGHAPAYDGGKGNLFKAQTGTGGMGERSNMVERHFDTGSAARFFYCAKASRRDRNEGCEQFDKRPLNWSAGTQNPGSFQAEGTDRSSQNFHPTVKPTALMAYLVRLVTPPGGVVLDPFMGSGSTGKAAMREGFGFIGIEMNPDYLAIAEARLAHAERAAAAATPAPSPQANLFEVAP